MTTINVPINGESGIMKDPRLREDDVCAQNDVCVQDDSTHPCQIVEFIRKAVEVRRSAGRSS